MSLPLWTAIIVMTVAALAFVIRPMVRESGRMFVVAVGIAVPIFAVGIYVLLGSPNVQSGRSTSSSAMAPDAAARPTSTGEKVGSVSSMVDGLAARLEENPDDAKGWLLLARSYQHMNRPDDAAFAYAKAVALGEHDADLEKTGSGAPADGMSTVRIAGNLSLSAEAAALVQPSDTVFIFARAANGSGPPAAVLRKSAAELPIDFELNDSQSMVDSIKLSQFDEVVVTARVSRSGNAGEALKGLEAKSDPVVVAENNRINLIIEQ